MKNIISLILVLCLAACIEVKDWGCYRQNFFQDDRLLGTWIAETSKPEREAFAVWPYLNGYILLPNQPKNRAKAKNDSNLFWTIKIGGYDFMLTGGLLYRYEIVGSRLKMLELDTEGHFEEIGKIVAHAATIKLEKIKPEQTQLTYTTLKIDVMDAAAAAALVELAAKPDLWKETQTARRASE